MKKIIMYYSCFVLFLLLSCTKKVDNTEYNIIIDPSTNHGKYNISHDVETSFDLLALETNENCLIGQIRNISYHNGKYYILDDKGVSIFIFDNKGQFISKLDKQGAGPDEYVRISTLFVEEDKIWIFDDMTYRILCYNKYYEMIEEIKTNGFSVFDLIVIDGNILLGSNYLWHGENSNNLKMYDAKRNITNHFPFEQPANNIAISTKNKQLSKYGKTALFIFSYDNTIYEIKENLSVKPQYSYQFTERFEDRPLAYDEVDKDPKTIRGIENINQTKQNILIKYIDNGEPKLAIYNKQGKETKVYESTLINSDLGNLILPWTYIIDNENIVCPLNPDVLIEYGHEFYDLSKFKDMEIKEEFESIISKMKPDDNPIIIRFRLKETSKL